MLRIILYEMILIICCAYALARGGAPERSAAAMMLAASLASFVTQSQPFSGSFQKMQMWVFVIDMLLLVGLFVLAVASTRFWPLWLAGFQLLAVTAHFIRAVDQSALSRGYQFLISFEAYPMLLLVALGAWRHRRRLQLYGADRSWRDSSSL
ncbi:MAG: hypothetical protein P0Y59_15515 [Candidatus Sphingomonas phytovorans]|nr:hypothetical protein [Sphingomonas sp.]WEJ98351.1 MAG: hypothetical protein P0Y59_15515 [Sphingomonas sp.]